MRKADLQSLQEEAGGLMNLTVIRQVDAPALVDQVIAGDREAATVMGALGDALAQVRSASKQAPALCGCCPRHLRKVDFSVVLAIPHREDASRCLFVGICTRCATEPEAIRLKALEAFRAIWPDVRPIDIPVTHAAGHA